MTHIRQSNNSAYATVPGRLAALLAACLLAAGPCIAQAQPGKYRLIISNQTRIVVDQVRLSPSGENRFGSDHVGNSVLKPGQAITVPNLAPGQYDVKFVDDFGNACVMKGIPVFSEMSWNITDTWIGNCAGFGKGRTQTAESGYRLSVKNNSRLSVLEIRASPGSANQWGPDLTGDTTLRPGGTFVLKNLAATQYDLKFIVEDGDSCILKGVSASDQPSWSMTMQWLRGCGEDGTRHTRSVPPSESGFLLTVNNTSKFPVYEIRVSPAGTNQWGPDRTSDMIVNAGESVIVKNLKPGQYDVKFVDEDGDSCILKDVTISRHQSWNLTMQVLRNCEGFGPGHATAQKF